MIEILDVETQALNPSRLKIHILAPSNCSFVTLSRLLNLAQLPSIQKEKGTPTLDSNCHNS